MNKKVLYLGLLVVLFVLLTYFCVIAPNYLIIISLISINTIVVFICVYKAVSSKNFYFFIFPVLLFVFFAISFIAGNYIYGLIQQGINKRAEVFIKALDKFYQNNRMYPKSIEEIIPKYLKTSKNELNDFLYIGENSQFELYVRDKNCGRKYKSITKKWFYNPCP